MCFCLTLAPFKQFVLQFSWAFSHFPLHVLSTLEIAIAYHSWFSLGEAPALICLLHLFSSAAHASVRKHCH